MLLKKKYKKLKKLDLEPKLKKPILFLLSTHNEDTKQLLKDLYQICKEFSIFRQNNSKNIIINKKLNEICINNKNHLESEFICNKLGFGLYVITSSNKKRPNSIGFGRLYNQNILDCCQFNILQYKSINKFNQSSSLPRYGACSSSSNYLLSYTNTTSLGYRLTKLRNGAPLRSYPTNYHFCNLLVHLFYFLPLIIVQGSGFGQQNGHLITVRNILLDIFKGPNYPKISLDNIKQLITITILDQYDTMGKGATGTPGKGANSMGMECTMGKGANFTLMECTSEKNLNEIAAVTNSGESSTFSNTGVNTSGVVNSKDIEASEGTGTVGASTVTEKLERRKLYKNGPIILFRRYSIKLLKSNKSNNSNEILPKVDLIEIGPSIDLQLEEVLNADPEIYKNSIQTQKRPKKLIAGINTNGPIITTDELCEISTILDSKENSLLNFNGNSVTVLATAAPISLAPKGLLYSIKLAPFPGDTYTLSESGYNGEILGYGNVSELGDFNLPVMNSSNFYWVLQSALNRRNITCEHLSLNQLSLEMFQYNNSIAFICNIQEHWFSIRKLHNEWFILDSLKDGPIIIEYGSLYDYIKEILEKGIGVILLVITNNGKFPEPEPYKYILQSNQFFLKLSEITNIDSFNNNKKFIWPTTGGIRLDQYQSNEEYIGNDAIRIAIKLFTNERLTNSFSPNNTINKLFEWIEKKCNLKEYDYYFLIQTIPYRKFIKYINGSIELLTNSNEPNDVTNKTFQQLNFNTNDMFLLRIN
ncbi:uncharacterized protein TA20250 [Theileria annulata]|uniref:Ribosome production factor 2 homolog n=1 Tax=Theileria annulata TaxID=5874 RepID=Q4UHA7_THEAN|nr:uncharacterized protein TA20250 [Theileria annulata]CAI73532.1 hypothetical protein TA20250 [Theileria annulata]|eukprot:XP_954209.1 hypothetical protein TA20250 [Theileria annulata]